ncbi:unnamed protein product [Mortierella alpina]
MGLLEVSCFAQGTKNSLYALAFGSDTAVKSGDNKVAILLKSNEDAATPNALTWTVVSTIRRTELFRFSAALQCSVDPNGGFFAWSYNAHPAGSDAGGRSRPGGFRYDPTLSTSSATTTGKGGWANVDTPITYTWASTHGDLFYMKDGDKYNFYHVYMVGATSAKLDFGVLNKAVTPNMMENTGPKWLYDSSITFMLDGILASTTKLFLWGSALNFDKLFGMASLPQTGPLPTTAPALQLYNFTVPTGCLKPQVFNDQFYRICAITETHGQTYQLFAWDGTKAVTPISMAKLPVKDEYSNAITGVFGDSSTTYMLVQSGVLPESVDGYSSYTLKAVVLTGSSAGSVLDVPNNITVSDSVLHYAPTGEASSSNSNTGLISGLVVAFLVLCFHPQLLQRGIGSVVGIAGNSEDFLQQLNSILVEAALAKKPCLKQKLGLLHKEAAKSLETFMAGTVMHSGNEQDLDNQLDQRETVNERPLAQAQEPTAFQRKICNQHQRTEQQNLEESSCHSSLMNVSSEFSSATEEYHQCRTRKVQCLDHAVSDLLLKAALGETILNDTADSAGVGKLRHVLDLMRVGRFRRAIEDIIGCWNLDDCQIIVHYPAFGEDSICSSITPMSSSSSSHHDPIASLLQSDDFKSAMRSVLREALGSALDQDPPHQDEQVAPPVVTELYTPFDKERERCPGIWPEDPRVFFRRTVSADDWNNLLRRYPKNTRVSYDPPALPSVLLHQVLSAGDVPEESEELFINFANHMREQLELLASKITTVRMDNLRKDKGLPASDSANLLIDPQSFNDEIKAAKSLSAAFAPQKSTSSSSNFNRRGKSGK